MSSANLPRPRNRRSSSLRGSEAPTQRLLPFFFSSATFSSASLLSARYSPPQTFRGQGRPRHTSYRQCRLQSVDQFLNLFLAQRFEHAAGDGRQAAEDLRFTLPVHFGGEHGFDNDAVCSAIVIGDRSNPATMVTFPPPPLPVLYIARGAGGRPPTVPSSRPRCP